MGSTAEDVVYAAEAGVLGAALLAPATVDAFLCAHTAEDFGAVEHADLYRALAAHHATGRPLDPMLLLDCAVRGGYTACTEGVLVRVTQNAPVGPVLEDYRAIVRRAALARRTQAVGKYIAGLADGMVAGDDAALDACLANVQTAALELADGHTSRLAPQQFGGYFLDVLEALDPGNAKVEALPCPTGYTEVDAILNGGLRGGQLVIVAARPGIGKSTAAMDICRHLSFRGTTPTMFFSMEMSATDCINRILAAECDIPLRNMLTGTLVDDADWDKVGNVLNEFMLHPFYLCTRPGLTIEELEQHITMAVRRHGIRGVVIDYVQLVNTTDRHDKAHERIGNISKRLKELANRLDIFIVAIAQLNRGPEQRSDKRPQASDLKESGQLEQDADVIVLLYREDSFDPETVRAGEADFIIAKNRNGPTGTVTVAYQATYSRFVDMAAAPPAGYEPSTAF